MNALVERALSPLDGVRRYVIRALLERPALKRVFVRRDARVPWLLSLHGVVAFALAVFIPSLPLALTPITLGVPHVAADVRYLVLRRGLPRAFRHAVWLIAAAMVALRVAYEAHMLDAAPMLAEHALGSAWVLLGALFGTYASRIRYDSLAVIAGACGLGALALAFPSSFQLVLAHAHNPIAMLIWLTLFRRSLRTAWLPISLMLGGAGLLASGTLLDFTLRHGRLSALGLHLFLATDWIAPGLPDGPAVALTTSFAYLQGLHYAIWLVAIPQQDSAAQGSTTFRMAWRGLVGDFGRSRAGLICGLTVCVLVAGAVSPLLTRNLYLSLATFHSWLELALLAFMLARGSAVPRAPGSPA
jgi:hypothetical protein